MCRRTFSLWGYLSVIAALACLSGTQTASAQSLFGGGGGAAQPGRAQGGGGLGMGVSPTAANAGGFSGAFGGGNQLGQGGGLNAGGQAGQAGQAAFAGPQIATELGALSATVGQGDFVGRSDTAGRFVGNQAAGQQAIQGTNTTGLGQFGGGQFGGGQFGGNQFGGRNGGFNQQNNFNQRNQRTIRPQHRIAFAYPQPATTSVQTRLNTQFQRLQTNRPELQGVQIEMGTDREAVLRGQVRSEDDRKLAAMLARMEPGVRTVKNELTIQGN